MENEGTNGSWFQKKKMNKRNAELHFKESCSKGIKGIKIKTDKMRNEWKMRARERGCISKNK